MPSAAAQTPDSSADAREDSRADSRARVLSGAATTHVEGTSGKVLTGLGIPNSSSKRKKPNTETASGYESANLPDSPVKTRHSGKTPGGAGSHTSEEERTNRQLGKIAAGAGSRSSAEARTIAADNAKRRKVQDVYWSEDDVPESPVRTRHAKSTEKAQSTGSHPAAEPAGRRIDKASEEGTRRAASGRSGHSGKDAASESKS